MKVLVVDDEKPARERLIRLLEEEPDYDVVGEAANGQKALTMAAKLQPDVVLLDIRMPGMQGIEVAQHLNQLEKPPAVIFATAYDQYAIAAFDAQAVGYILKPVRRHRLLKALELAARLNTELLQTVAGEPGLQQKRQHLCVRVQDELKLISLNDVYCFTADSKYVRVCHKTGEHLLDESLKGLEVEFSADFVRIHRNALVAVAQIEAIDKDADGLSQVRLRDKMIDQDFSLPISRRHLPDVRRRLKGG